MVSHYFLVFISFYFFSLFFSFLFYFPRLTHYSPANQKEVLDINKITPSTGKVVFHVDFDNEVSNLLPQQITHLTFKGDFERSLSPFHPTLTHLHFQQFFDQTINSNNLPSTLVSLKFEYFFNQAERTPRVFVAS